MMDDTMVCDEGRAQTCGGELLCGASLNPIKEGVAIYDITSGFACGKSEKCGMQV